MPPRSLPLPLLNLTLPFSTRHTFAPLTRHTLTLPCPLTRRFHASPPPRQRNRLHTPVRTPSDWSSLLLLSSSSRTPLLTLWSTSFCASGPAVASLLTELIGADGVGEGVGEGAGGVAFVQVEMDAPDLMGAGGVGGLGGEYVITSVPTLLAFSRGEAQMLTKVTEAEQLRDRDFLSGWIEREARRGGHGGAGGVGFLGRLLGLGRGE